MEVDKKQTRKRWAQDTVTIALMGTVFYFIEVLSIYAFRQWLGYGYLPSWEAKTRFLAFAIVLCSSMGLLLGTLSGLLLRSKRYLIAMCPMALVAAFHLVQLPTLTNFDPARRLAAIGYAFGLGTLYLGVAILVAVGITFVKRRRDFCRVRLTTIRIGLPVLALGVGCYVGWGFGRTSVAAPDLIFNTRLHLNYLKLLEDSNYDRLRHRLQSMLDSYALAMPSWRKAVLRPHTREQIDDALLRIARYRQEHPKDTDYDVGPADYEQRWLKAWQERDRQLEAIYQKALESAPNQAGEDKEVRTQEKEEKNDEQKWAKNTKKEQMKEND